jgi:hypothetical protein
MLLLDSIRNIVLRDCNQERQELLKKVEAAIYRWKTASPWGKRKIPRPGMG